MGTTKWELDPAHSEIIFKVKHLLISTVTGRFKNFDLQLETQDDDFMNVSRVVFTADVNSIDTNNEARDAHLKSEDFFDGPKYAKIKFTADSFSVVGAEAMLKGQLTIRGIQHPVEVKVDFGGLAKDGYGETRVGFSISGKISRREFGLTWNALTETGGTVVGDEIKFEGELQLIKQK